MTERALYAYQPGTYMDWVDYDVKKPLETKIQEGAEHFKDKYGIKPNICVVNTQDYPSGVATGVVKGIEIRATMYVHINHCYLGRVGGEEGDSN